MTTTPQARPPVARLRSPAELAAALPHLCGFVPTESLVVVALHGPRHRVGLTMRVDLPAGAHEEPLVDDLVQRLQHTRADEAVVLVCTEASDDGDLPRARLVRRLLRRLRRAAIRSDDALLVREGRWSSYECRDEHCCPAEGTPLALPASTAGLSLVATESVTRGVAVLPSRDALVAQLAAPPASEAVLHALSAATEQHRSAVVRRGRADAGRASLAAWRRALREAPRAAPDDQARALLVTALQDVAVRDEVLTSLLDDDERLLWLLLALARWTPSPHDVQVCALLGWTAYARGHGALANVALDRALASDPGCTLAALARQALDTQLPPAGVRELLAGTRAVLRAAHPWTAA